MAETSFIDAETDYKSENTSFREIIMRHVERISIKSTAEMSHGGFWDEQFKGNGIMRTWVPDAKDVYNNAVRSLSHMLHAFYDEQMQKAEEEFEKKLDSLHKHYYTKSKEDDGLLIPKSSTHQKLFLFEKYQVHCKLFRSLCDFLKRKKYLDIGAIEE